VLRGWCWFKYSPLEQFLGPVTLGYRRSCPADQCEVAQMRWRAPWAAVFGDVTQMLAQYWGFQATEGLSPEWLLSIGHIAMLVRAVFLAKLSA